MASGLAALLDDVAALAKLAAASIDDVGASAGRASAKAAGVVVDDAAVTPAYVRGLAAKRELPIIRKIATGSIRNKIVFILPAILILSEFVPTLVEIILMIGGTYLAFEGAEKVYHLITHDKAHTPEVPAAALGPEAEAKTVSGAIRTDFILSAEIMVIALKEVLDESLLRRGVILVVVAIAITAVVYGAVALIVKMDDVGLRLAETGQPASQRIGRLLVAGMPKLLSVLALVGTAAMVWVGGHILLVGADELGWHWPYSLVHDVEHEVEGISGVGGALAWIVNTAMSAIVGLAVGALVVVIVSRVRRGGEHTADHAPAAH